MTFFEKIDRLLWWALVPVLTVALIWPAYWNGYPLLFFDSGDYLALSILLEPIEFRTLPYAILIRPLHLELSAWPIVVFQALAAAWTVREAVFAYCARRRGLTGVLIGLLLVAVTGLPWVAAQIMPDVFAGVAILAMALLVAAPLPRWRRVLLGVIALIAIACHVTHTLVGIALVLVALAVLYRLPSARGRIAACAGIVTAAFAVVPATNWLTTGEIYYSRGGALFFLGRLVHDGVAKKYLDQVCPDPAYKLCEHKDNLPVTHNDFLWNTTEAFDAMGGWENGGPEADRIVYGSLRDLPLMVIWTGLRSGVRQLTLVRSADGIGKPYIFLAEAIKLVIPGEYEQFQRSRQQTGKFDLRQPINVVHLPVQLAACLGLALWTIFRWRQMSPQLRAFCLMILAGLVANALVCGGLSNPTNRYQGRVAWLEVMALAIAIAARNERHRPSP